MVQYTHSFEGSFKNGIIDLNGRWITRICQGNDLSEHTVDWNGMATFNIHEIENGMYRVLIKVNNQVLNNSNYKVVKDTMRNIAVLLKQKLSIPTT